MASGFGSFTSGTTVSSATVNAVLSQSVNSSARTVTVSLRITAAYRRTASGSWTPGSGVAIWGSANTGNYMTGNLDGTTGGISGKYLGVSSVSGKTYSNGGVYTIPNGQIQVRSGYYGDTTISKTYNYNSSGSAISGSWSVEMYVPGLGSTKIGVSGSFTTDSISPSYVVPTPTTPSITEVTPSTVKGTFAVSSWGGTSASYIAARLFGPSGSGRLEQQTNGVSSYTTTITNSSIQLDGGTTIKGAGTYYADTYASNSAGGASSSRVTVYTPPAELASITYEQTAGATNVSITPKITGGSSTVNASGAVTTSYRYSTNGGSTWSAWTAISGTATAWTEKTGSAFTCNYGASVKIQAKQTYQSKDSAVKEASFTATTGTAPSGGTLTVDSSTWNSITLTATGVSYGAPSGISGRKLAIGVHAYNDNTTKRENQIENVTGATTTVDNSSVYPGGTALQLKGMADVYLYIWAWNTVTSTYVVNETSPYYLPPAPGSASYTEDGNDEYTIRYTGVVADNVTDYTASELTRTVRYKIGSGNWVYVENDTQMALDAVTSETIEILPTQSATVEAWMTYRGKNSTVSTFTISNSNDPIYLYGSVNGEATKIRHLYGSVNGETVKITKLYGSVNGVARKVFEDV